jgi:hypothetical protein
MDEDSANPIQFLDKSRLEQIVKQEDLNKLNI